MIVAGTYIREPDGAWHMYHNPLTSWNFPLTSLREYLAGTSTYSLGQWRKVTDQAERDSVYEWLGSNLLPGEFFSINQMEVLDYQEHGKAGQGTYRRV